MNIRKLMATAFLSFFVLAATACSNMNTPAPVLGLDGQMEVTIGKTTIGEITEAGFSNRYLTKNKMIPKQSWETLYAVKDDLNYGAFSGGNKKSKEIVFEEGVIFKVTMDYDDSDHPSGLVLVDGVDYNGYTRDQIKETLKDKTPTLDSDNYLVYKNGKFDYTFRFADGSEIITGISIDDGTETKIEFK